MAETIKESPPLNPRTGQPLVAGKPIAAALGHPPCPSCGATQSTGMEPNQRRCANCGNIWKPEIKK